jgi:hypothetical protein
MAGLTLEVSELSAHTVTALVAPFSHPHNYNACGQHYNAASLNFGTRPLGSGLRHSSTAMLRSLDSAVRFWLTLRHYSCRSTPPPLPQFAGVACIPQGILFHSFVSTAEINAKSV